VHLIDLTGLRLSELSADWARFSDGVCGAKLHIVFDPDAERPIDAAITPARLNDITAAQALPIAAARSPAAPDRSPCAAWAHNQIARPRDRREAERAPPRWTIR
jgi:hypothetical protein